MSHFHEDVFEVSAGHRQKNAPSSQAFERRLHPTGNEKSLQFTTQAYKLQGWRIGIHLVAHGIVFK